MVYKSQMKVHLYLFIPEYSLKLNITFKVEEYVPHRLGYPSPSRVPGPPSHPGRFLSEWFGRGSVLALGSLWIGEKKTLFNATSLHIMTTRNILTASCYHISWHSWLPAQQTNLTDTFKVYSFYRMDMPKLNRLKNVKTLLALKRTFQITHF